MIDPRPFQRRFLARALAPGIDTAALSIPRGNGKTWLAGHVLTRCLTPGDGLWVEGAEYLLSCSCSHIATALRAASMPSGRNSRNTSVATAASTRMPPNAMHQFFVPWLRRAPRQL